MMSKKFEIFPDGTTPTSTMGPEETRRLFDSLAADMAAEKERQERLRSPFKIEVGKCSCGDRIMYLRSFKCTERLCIGGPSEEVWECYCQHCGLRYHRDAKLIAPVIRSYLDGL